MFHKDKPTTYFIMDCCCQPNCGNLKKIPTQQTYGPFCFVRSLARKHPFLYLKVFWFSCKKKFLPQSYFTLVLSFCLFLWYIFRSTNYVIIQCSGEIRGQLVVKSWIESCDHPKKLSQEKTKKVDHQIFIMLDLIDVEIARRVM